MRSRLGRRICHLRCHRLGQTVFDVRRCQVNELTPGSALIVSRRGDLRQVDILGQNRDARCSFERIYFSRGSDADIYRERKALGRNLTGAVIDAIGGDFDHTVFSFIPNTAEVAFIGLIQGLEQEMDEIKTRRILEAAQGGELTRERLKAIMNHTMRVEKVAIKDIKLRTFIAEGESRNDLAAHVYDVTYGIIENDCDCLL